MKVDVRPAFGVWITGLPASGKSTVAAELVQRIRAMGVQATVLESDSLRTIFSSNPQYDDRDREYFYGSLAFVGRVLIDHGISVIFDATANRRSYRERARGLISRFIEVFVDCPLDHAPAEIPRAFIEKHGKARLPMCPDCKPAMSRPKIRMS